MFFSYVQHVSWFECPLIVFLVWPQRFFLGHDDDILCMAMHPDKKTVATGQVGTWLLLRQLSHELDMIAYAGQVQ